VKGGDIRGHQQVDLEARVVQAHRNVTRLQYEPVAACARTSEIELNDYASLRQPRVMHATPHTPQQQARIQLVWLRIT
jgi:hypothetical protein